MSARLTGREASRLAAMTPEERRAFLKRCSPRDLLMLDADFEMWANEAQLPPEVDGWRVWLMMAGRGFGKTRAGAEWVHRLAMGRPVRIALVAATIDEARSVMIEGLSGLLAVARRQRVKLNWEPSRGVLHWPRGSQAQLFSGAHGDGMRGPEHNFAWCAPVARRAGCGQCRRAAADRTAGGSSDRKQLHPHRQPDRGVERPSQCSCQLFVGRLALHRAGRGHERSRQEQRCCGDLSQ